MLIDDLIKKIILKKNPTCVGLDPDLDFIPNFIKEDAFKKFGHTPKAVKKIFVKFNKMIIDETADLIPAVKPQIAMYERYGIEGIKAYVKTVEYAKSKGLFVIGDIKRGDISSTAKAYSKGHIGKSEFEVVENNNFTTDFITVNPYMGSDCIQPFLADCKENNKGLFILVKTSNPSSNELQDLLSTRQAIYEKVGLLVEKWGEGFVGKYGYSSIGAVVGATHKKQAEKLRKIMPKTFFLIPGYGAQGGTAEDLAVCFDKKGLGGIVNSSRGIINAYNNEKYKLSFSEEEFAKASRQAVIDMKADLGRLISSKGK